MTHATHLPRCPARLANHRRRMVNSLAACLVSLTASLATASQPATVDESPDRFVGPPSRLQPRLSNETGTPRTLTTLMPARLVNPAAIIYPIAEYPVAEGPVSRLPARGVEFLAQAQPLPQTEPLDATPAEDLDTLDPPPAPPMLAPATPQPPFFDEPQLLDAAPPQEPIQTGEPLPCYVPKPMSLLTTNINFPEGALPANVALECAVDVGVVNDARLEYGWAQFDFHWAATCLCHRPLYFEDVNAERYGYTISRFFQPVISGAKFFLTIPALPYKMAVDPPHECIYTLGHYRPGSCVPWRTNYLPLKLTAAAVEVGTIAGLILLLP